MKIGFLVVVGVALALITTSRARVWSSEPALWAEAVHVSPEKPRPWVNFANQERLAGRYTSAALAYQHASELAAFGRRAADEQALGQAVANMNLAMLCRDTGTCGPGTAITGPPARIAAKLALLASLETRLPIVRERAAMLWAEPDINHD